MIQIEVQQEGVIQQSFKHSQNVQKQIYINSSVNRTNQNAAVQQLTINDRYNNEQISYVNDNQYSLQNQYEDLQQIKKRKSQTDIAQEEKPQIKSIINTISMNNTMKINTINFGDCKNNIFKGNIQSKDDTFNIMKVNKTKDTLFVKNLDGISQNIDNDKRLIVMRSLNESDFKNAKLNSIQLDRPARKKRIKSPLKRIKLNDSANHSTKNDSNYNTFLNSDFSASIAPYNPFRKGMSIFCNNQGSDIEQKQIDQQANDKFQDLNKKEQFKIHKQDQSEKNEEEFQQNKNVLKNDESQNQNRTTQSNSRQSQQILFSRIKSRNEANNEMERSNVISILNQNDVQSEEDDDLDIVQSFYTQNIPQQKEQTINIQMKDLRFFQNSRNIIVVDLKNPSKIEQLCKEKTMKDWFMRRKSCINQGQANQNIKQNIISNEQSCKKEISLQQPIQDDKINKIPQPEEEDERQCKICFEGEAQQIKEIETSKKKKRKSKIIPIKQSPLLSPCLCQGSMKYIHEECLKEWIISKLCQQIRSNGQALSDLSQTSCEICQYTYRMDIMLGDKFLPSQAIRKGRKPVFFSTIAFLIACLLFYLTFHFTYQSVSGDEDKMEAGYSLGIGVCSGIIACVFLCISIICLKECLYVKKIVTWIIYNSERQKKIQSTNNQFINKTYNGFRIRGEVPNEQVNHEVIQQNELNNSQNINQSIDQNNQTNSNILQNQFLQSDINETTIYNQIQQPQNQNESISRIAGEQIISEDDNSDNIGSQYMS